MIEVQMKDIVNNSTILQELLDKKLKGKTALNLARIIREMEPEYKTFQDTRTNLIKKYGKQENGELITDENGNYHIRTEDVEKFNNELEELLNVDITLNANKIDINDLNDIEFTPRQMVFLEKFIEE